MTHLHHSAALLPGDREGDGNAGGAGQRGKLGERGIGGVGEGRTENDEADEFMWRLALMPRQSNLPPGSNFILGSY